MAENRRPSRILDVSGKTDNSNEQQYVEVGSNIYLGTKDGMKYSLIQTADSKFRLVEALIDSNITLNDSSGLFQSSKNNEDLNKSNLRPELKTSGSKDFKIISVKPEESPCKGQGDEIGNSVISSPNYSFKKSDNNLLNVDQEGTPIELGDGSLLTYTTLLPRQDKKDSLDDTYYITPPSTFCNYSSPFPVPAGIRPERHTKRSRIPVVPGGNLYSPIPRVRRGGSRLGRPRQTMYQYTPQILHSTPTASSELSYGSDSSLSKGASSSGSLDKTQPSIEYPRVPNNTPTSPDEDSSCNQKVFSLQWMPHIATHVENCDSPDPRETHNQKERNRRLRIKNACQYMKRLVPFITEKTDNATVFEQAAYYITFVRSTIGNESDMEFLETNYVS